LARKTASAAGSVAAEEDLSPSHCSEFTRAMETR
jgi:hypothetical protein